MTGLHAVRLLSMAVLVATMLTGAMITDSLTAPVSAMQEAVCDESSLAGAVSCDRSYSTT